MVCLFDARPRKESQCTINLRSVDRVQENDEVECEQTHTLLSAVLFYAFSWVWNLQPHLICLGPVKPRAQLKSLLLWDAFSIFSPSNKSPCVQFCFHTSAAGTCLFPALV